MKLALNAAAALLTLTGAAALAVCAPEAEAAGAQADANQPCDRLIDQARHLPDGAWAAGAKALEPSLTINDMSPGSPSPLETAIAKLPEVRKGLADEGGAWAVSVDRLPNTDIYVASDYQGTLHCQGSVFLSAPEGADAKLVNPPPGWGDEEVCWTQSASPGQVFGRPAFIEHGAVSQTTDDERIGITPWIGSGWGPGCRVGLHFRPRYKQTARHCRDKIVCAAADKIAMSIVAAYNRWPDEARDTGKFWYGAKPSADTLHAVGQLADPKTLSNTADFPISGSGDNLGFSYSGFALFPLTLNGKPYVAAIGHTGVGWRESRETVLAIYAQNAGRLTRLADFGVSRSIGGLQSAALETPKPAPGR